MFWLLRFDSFDGVDRLIFFVLFRFSRILLSA